MLRPWNIGEVAYFALYSLKNEIFKPNICLFFEHLCHFGVKKN